MPKNRDYTGLVRTPSSMAWLIRKRSLLQGQIDRRSKMQGDIPDKIKTLQAELDALNAVIPLHEVPVDPKVIKGRKPKGPALAQHGELTRFLLNRPGSHLPRGAKRSAPWCQSQRHPRARPSPHPCRSQSNPTAGQFANGDYKLVLGEAIAKTLASHHAMSEQTLQNPKVFEDVAEALLAEVYEKARGAQLSAV